MIEGNCKSLGIHAILNNSKDVGFQDEEVDLQVHERFLSSPWYKDIVYFRRHCNVF